MALKATFPMGVTGVTVNGLHQWDYGRKLEIHADGLPSIVEVHFACLGMKDAVVRSCAVIDGVATAAIPDRCLEQTTPITAWIYEVGETSGETTRTITLPIIARPRPQSTKTPPEDFSDKYTEAVAGFNAVVEEAAKGNLTVARAVNADYAAKAVEAEEAARASKADVADCATSVEIDGENPFPDPTTATTKLPGSGYYCIIATHNNNGVSAPVFVYWNGLTQLFCGVIGETAGTGEGTVLDTLFIMANGYLDVQRTTNGNASYADDEYSFKIAKLWG